MEEFGCIYLIICLVNNKKYVGQHNNLNPDERYKRHWSEANKGCKFALHSAMRLHGITNFKIEILRIVTRDKLNNMEEYYAEQLETYTWDTPGGYNMVYCGNQPMLGYKHSDESKKNISIRFKNMVRTDEQCRKIGEGVKEYIKKNPEIMKDRYNRTSKTLTGRKTGPQSKECIQRKIDNNNSPIPTSSGERHIWQLKNGNWRVSVDNKNYGKFCRTFDSLELAVSSRDKFIDRGERTESPFMKKAPPSNHSYIRIGKKNNWMVDIHSKKYGTFSKTFPTLEGAISARDEFMSKHI
jgi:group I intron endonuclease